MASKDATYRSRTFFLVCTCNLLLFISFQMLLPILPVYLKENVDGASAGVLVGLITLAAVAVRPFAGYALDRMNRRTVVIAGSAVLALSAAALAISSNLIFTLIVSLFLGVGWGIMTAAYGTVVSDLIPAEQQGAGIGTFMIFGMIGMAVAPLAGEWLLGNGGPASLFLSASLIALLSLALSFSVSLQKPSGAIAEQSKKEPAERGWSQLRIGKLIDRSSLLPMVIIFLYTICYGGILSFVTLYGIEKGFANSAAFFLVAYGAAIGIRPLAGKIYDVRGPGWAIVPGVTAGIAALAVLSAADSWAAFGAAAVLYGLSFGSAQPSIMAWTVGRASADRRGAANSAFLIGMDGGIAVGSVLLGGVVQLFGYAGIFRYSIVFLLLMLVVLAVGVLSRDSKVSVEK